MQRPSGYSDYSRVPQLEMAATTGSDAVSTCSAAKQGAKKKSLSEIRLKIGSSLKQQRVQCDTCGKHYSSRKSLKIHIRTHTGYKPYKCTICPKSFSQSNVLKAHINAHIGQRDFFCHICGRAFTQSAHMKTHERIHTKRKDHTCTYCSRTFGSKGVLIRHFRQHTGEKPYRCARCPKTFTRAESLRSHENSHDGIRPHLCKFNCCNSTFTKKSSRKRHEKTCHRDLTSLMNLENQEKTLLEGEFGQPMTPLSPEVFNQCLEELFTGSIDDLEFLEPISPDSSTITDCSSSDSGFLSHVSSPTNDGIGRSGRMNYYDVQQVKIEPFSPSAYVPVAYSDPWNSFHFTRFQADSFNFHYMTENLPEPAYQTGAGQTALPSDGAAAVAFLYGGAYEMPPAYCPWVE